jgi:hypothetical protein
MDKVTFHKYSLMVCMEIEIKDFLSPHASHVIDSSPTYLGTENEFSKVGMT